MSTVLKWRADIDSDPVQLPVVNETLKRVVFVHPVTQRPTGEGKDCLDYSWHDSWESACQWRLSKLKQLRRDLNARAAQVKQAIDSLQSQPRPRARG